MSESINVRMPDGTVTTVNGAPNDEAARQRAYQDWQQRDPEAVSAWRRNLPLPGAIEAGVESFRGALGAIPAGVGTVQEYTGLGTGENARALSEYIAGTSATSIPTTRQFEGFSDLLQSFRESPLATARAATGQALGSVLGSIAAPAAVVGAGALAGVPGAALGATALGAGILTGALQGANELEQMLINEGLPREEAVRLAATVGSGIGAAEGGAAGWLLGRLAGRQIRREAIPGLVAAAQRTATGAGIREAGIVGAGEGVSEALGSMGREATAALATGNPDLLNRADRALLDFALGAAGGAMAGGAVGTRNPARARAELEQRGLDVTTGEPIPPAPPPGTTEQAEPSQTLLPEAPAPFVTAEAARNYLQSDPAVVNFPLTDDAAILLANVRQQERHDETIREMRTSALQRYLSTDVVEQRPAVDRQGQPVLDKNNNPVMQEIGRDIQATQFLERLVNAAVDPANAINLQSFSARDVANLALSPLDPTVEPSKAERNLIADQLKALQGAGYLMASKDGGYTVAGRDVEALLRRKTDREREAAATGVMPGTVESAQKAAGLSTTNRVPDITDETQRAATEFPNLTAQAMGAPATADVEILGKVLPGLPGIDPSNEQTISDLTSSLRGASQNVKDFVSKFIELQTESRRLIQESSQLTTGAAIKENAEKASAVANEKATIIDRLQGIFNGTFKGTDEGPYSTPPAGSPLPTEVTPTTQVGLQGGVQPVEGPPAEVAQTGTNLGTAINAATQRQNALAFITEAQRATTPEAFNTRLKADPAAAVSFLDIISQTKPPRSGFQIPDITKGAQAAGIKLTPEQASSLHTFAKTVGYVNGIGQLTGKSPDLSKVLTSPAPKQTTAQAPVEPTPPPPPPQASKPKPASKVEPAPPPPPSPPSAISLPENGPFKADEQITISKGVPSGKNGEPNAEAFAKELLNTLGLSNVRVFLTTKEDVVAKNFRTDYNVDNGPFRRTLVNLMRNESARESNRGLTADGGDGTHYWLMVDFARPAEQYLETMAHEIGHVLQFKAFENAPQATKDAVMKAHRKWVAANAKSTVSPSKYMEAFWLPYSALRHAEGRKETSADKLPQYYRSFGEWFANQVARWATTEQEPRTLVDRFFAGIAKAYRKITDTIGIRADKAVADFITSYRSQAVSVAPETTTPAKGSGQIAISADSAEQVISAPPLPANPDLARKIVQQQMDDQIGGVMKWFASPYMTLGKSRPALQPASVGLETQSRRTNQATYDTEELLAPFVKLSPASRAKVTQIHAAASAAQKAPDVSGLTATEQKGLQASIASFQRAFDYLVESATREHFDPASAKTPEARAKLEAFWRKHEGKHTWEIPPRELAAVSPAGWAAMQKLERLRNPYYLPQIAQGSHFVAAYKLLPSGKREIVGMRAYNPLNMVQKMRGFKDPEAEAIALLRQEFPNTRTHYVMSKGVKFSQGGADADRARLLREQGDFIGNYMSRLAEVSGKKGQAIIASMANEIDKAQLERLMRPNKNILRAVTPDNASSYIVDAGGRYLMSVAKIQARRYTQDQWQRATGNLSPNDQAYLNDLRNYITTPTEAFGGARALAFLWYLGGAVDTALINHLQLAQMTLPMLTRDGGLKATKYLTSAYKLVNLNRDLAKAFKNDSSFAQGLVARLTNKDEAAIIQRAVKDGIFTPVFTNEARGQFTAAAMSKMGFKDGTAAADRANRVTNLLGRFMQGIEMSNRMTTFLAAYRMAKDNPSVIANSNRADNTQHADAYAYAVGKVFDTQFLTTKEDRALIQRFTPAAEVATQFMSFPLKMIEQYARHAGMVLEGIKKQDPFLAKAGFMGFAGMVLPLVAMAGIWALPGAELLREILEKIAGKIWGSTQNFDMEMREALGGGNFATFVSRGGFHVSGAFSAMNRLKIDPMPLEELTNMSLIGMAGPAGGIAEAFMTRVPQYYANGDYWSMAAAMMPRAIGNVVRGAGLSATESQYTLKGNRIITPEILRAYDQTTVVPASLRQAMGLPPPAFSDLRDVAARQREIAQQTQAPTERINRELAGYLTRAMDAQRDNDTSEANRNFDRFQRRVVEIVNEQEGKPVDRQIRLNIETIRQRALRDFHGLASEEVLSRRGPVATRAEVLRQRNIILRQPATTE